jgi:hypothetical protein
MILGCPTEPPQEFVGQRRFGAAQPPRRGLLLHATSFASEKKPRREASRAEFI